MLRAGPQGPRSLRVRLAYLGFFHHLKPLEFLDGFQVIPSRDSALIKSQLALEQGGFTITQKHQPPLGLFRPPSRKTDDSLLSTAS